MKHQSKIFNYIALVASIFGIIDILIRYLGGASQIPELADFFLLILLSVLILLELSSPDSSAEPQFVIKKHLAIPILIASVGISMAFKSPSQIQETLSCGFFLWLITILFVKIWEIFTRKRGMDQGTYLTIFIIGLYVGDPQKIFALISLPPILALIFFLPRIIFRRGTSPIIPYLPFLVLSAIFINSPYYDFFAEPKLSSFIYKTQIKAIESFINDRASTEIELSHTSSKIYIEYPKNETKDVSLDELRGIYKTQTLNLVYNPWKTWAHILTFGKEQNSLSDLVFTDKKTGVNFVLKSKTIYYVQDFDIKKNP